jgi:hypothetical protein
MLCVGSPSRAEAQLGALLSPGPLAKAHQSLEGASNCVKCHERGNQVSAVRCLSCHAPVARRIAAKTGVHRSVTNDCVQCHAEHAGVSAELRPFDSAKFKHSTETAFPLTGLHAPVADKCAACHKTRSFLTASPACSTCHQDKHKGSLGTACERCHKTDVPFAAAAKAFDHSQSAFALTGAHRSTACAACHKTPDFKVAKFATCSSCHATPHAPKVSTACTSCHTTERWRTRTFDHTRTAFPLLGKHATADCASCHKAPATKVKPAAATCATCHTDPHKGTFKQDCRACHTEKSFAGAAFDHAAVTGYALTDRHGGLSCRSCHKAASPPGTPAAKMALDYRGLKTTCASCHVDPHQAELGSTCERCHTTKTFRVAAFSHASTREFFGGRHASVACEGCHKSAGSSGAAGASGSAGAAGASATRGTSGAGAVASRTPVSFAQTPTACASCHRDVHEGKLGAACESCHSVAAAKFVADRFSHDRTSYPLAGKHRPLACAACHVPRAAAAAATGAPVNFAGAPTTCAGCHKDTHLGQVGGECKTCHTPETFKVMAYKHRQPAPDFFTGRHLRIDCRACHAPVTRQFPAGRGTAINFSVTTACVSCHTDPHKGSLGTDCARCHKPEPLLRSHLR